MLNFSKIVHAKEERNTMLNTSELTFLDKSSMGLPRELPEDVLFLKETIRHLEDKLARIYHEMKDKESSLALREKACDQTSYSLHIAIEKLEKVKKQTNNELMKCKILLQESAERENTSKHRLYEVEDKVAFLSQELENNSKKIVQQELRLAQQERQIAQKDRQIALQERQIAELTNLVKFQGNPENRPQVFHQTSSQEESHYSPHLISKTAQEEDTLSLATASKNNSPKNRATPFGYMQPGNGMYLRGLQVVSDSREVNETNETRMGTIERQVEDLASDITEIKQVLMQICRKLDTKPDVNQEKVFSTINNFLKAAE